VRISLALACVLTCSAGLAHAQLSNDPRSLERVREGLLKPPPRLSLDLPKPDFSVIIEQKKPPLQDIFERPPWVSVPPEFPPPPGSKRNGHDGTIASASFDPVSVAHSISRAVRTRQARGEVERAIADYCIAHRDEPGAEAICAPPFR